MGMGMLADAWVSFGEIGGIFTLFFYGLIINLSLKLIQKNMAKYKILFYFIPIIYYYPIRPDCETQTSFGHLVKTFFLVFVILYYFIGKSEKAKV